MELLPGSDTAWSEVVVVYYNEHDAYAAQWLRNLCAAGLIARGDVDDRDIRVVQPGDVAGYAQCHFFAGIGGWSYALRLAGIPDDYPIWTGSCPCQPFSAAGKRQGAGDERHLWPAWLRLIGECRPARILGEHVGAAVGVGWLDDVFLSLEQVDYACGAVVFPACSVQAWHVRSRLWWVASAADSNGVRWEGEREAPCGTWDEQEFTGLVQDQLQHALPSGRLRALVDGVSERVGRLRAYGNAIVPQAGAAFIRAALVD